MAKSYEETLLAIQTAAQEEANADPKRAGVVIMPVTIVPMEATGPEVEQFIQVLLSTPNVGQKLLEQSSRLIYWINNK